MPDTFIPASDKDELTQLVSAANKAAMPLALHMASNLSGPMAADMVELKERGWSIGIEFSADQYGEPRIRLTAIDPEGKRCEPLAHVAFGAPGALS